MSEAETTQELLAGWGDVTIVPVDCSGAMSAGLGLRLRRRWPYLLDEYRTLLSLGLLGRGRPRFAHLIDPGLEMVSPLLFPVREDWREPARADFIEAGIDALPDVLRERIRTDVLVVPALTYGAAGKDWRPLFDRLRLPAAIRLEHVEVPGDLPRDEPLPRPAEDDAELARLQRLFESLGVHSDTLSRPCPTAEPNILRLWVRTDEWLDRWHALRKLVDVTGFWPVMLGAPGTAYADLDSIETEPLGLPGELPPAQKFVLEALATDAEEWLRQKRAVLSGRGWDGHDEPAFGNAWDETQQPLRHFSQPREMVLWGAPKMVAVGLLPTRAGWEAPAYLRLHAHNYSYPLPSADHVRLMASWWDRYGAEPAVIWQSEQTVEFHVTRPPQDRGAALTLAEEHFAYCSDRVGQDAGSIEALAAQLLDAPVWHFWWD